MYCYSPLCYDNLNWDLFLRDCRFIFFDLISAYNLSRDGSNRSPIEIAVALGKETIVECLLQYGVSTKIVNSAKVGYNQVFISTTHLSNSSSIENNDWRKLW